MDAEANRQLVKRFYEEVWSRGNVAFAEQVFADDYVRHDLRPGEPLPARPAKRRSLSDSDGRSLTSNGGWT